MEISNKRCIQILKLLLKNKECMTGDNLAVAIGVSSRTIRNDMKDLNRALEDHGASVVSEICLLYTSPSPRDAHERFK